MRSFVAVLVSLVFIGSSCALAEDAVVNPATNTSDTQTITKNTTSQTTKHKKARKKTRKQCKYCSHCPK